MSKLIITTAIGTKEVSKRIVEDTETDDIFMKFSKPRKLKQYLKELTPEGMPPLVPLKGTYKLLSYRHNRLVEACRVNLSSNDHTSLLTESNINRIRIESVSF